VDSPAHRQFFASLKVDPIPACVTAVPIKSDDVLVGVLMAFGGNESKGTEALETAIKVCQKLVPSLTVQWGKVA
jgi:hypothetical protein